MRASPPKLMMQAWSVFLGCALLGTALAEETNIYLSIPERNPFGLVPPPPPAPPPTNAPPPAAPAATVKLTGITSIFSTPKALFEVIEPGPGKTPRKPILKEDERDGDLHVISINVEKGEVTARIAGALTNITFAPVESPKTPAPAVPVTAALPVAQEGPMVISRAAANATAPRSSVTLLGAPPTLSPVAPAQAVGPTYNAASTLRASSSVADRLRSIPSRTIRSNPEEPPSAHPPLTKEQLRILMEANRTLDPARAAIYPNVN